MKDSLESLLAGPDLVVIPGAYDALSARIAARAGARAVYMTGFGVAGASFAVPDLGMIGSAEMIERARAMCSAAAPVPLIADGDNGHGGPLNVARLVRGFEDAGVAAIQLEDQVMPKRCGHMEGKEVVPLAEAAAKIRAAVGARNSASFKIIARTDARAVAGLDEALRRGAAFLEAGADILFIEAPQTEEELRTIGKTFAGTPLVANLVEDGKTPLMPPAQLKALGYKIALYPITALLATAHCLRNVYESVLQGKSVPTQDRLRFADYNELVGLSDAIAFVEKCAKA